MEESSRSSDGVRLLDDNITSTSEEIHSNVNENSSSSTHTDLNTRVTENILQNLVEVRHWYNVSAEERLNRTVVRGQLYPGRKFETVLPLNVSESVSVKELRETVEKHGEECQKDTDDDSVILAMTAKDSTSVFYRLHNGLVPPRPLNETQEEKRFREEVFINRRQRRQNAEELLKQERESKEGNNDPVESDS